MTRDSCLYVSLVTLLALSLVSCADDERPGKQQITLERLGALSSAAIIFEQRFGALPGEIDSLAEVGAPYFSDSLLIDGWGSSIEYQLIGHPEDGRFRFCSAGPDQNTLSTDDNICSEWLDVRKRNDR